MHGEKINVYTVFVVKPEGKRSLGILTHRWEDNIKNWSYRNRVGPCGLVSSGLG
jgi:hypothetical protein